MKRGEVRVRREYKSGAGDPCGTHELNRSSAQSDEGERTRLGVLLASSLSVSSALTSCAGDVWMSESGCSTTET